MAFISSGGYNLTEGRIKQVCHRAGVCGGRKHAKKVADTLSALLPPGFAQCTL